MRNFSPRLVESLADLYSGSEHVENVGLSGGGGGDVWDYAKANGFAIVSKDSDIADRSVLDDASPKVIWIRLGNCSTSDVERVLRSQYEAIRSFIVEDRETFLLFGRV